MLVHAGRIVRWWLVAAVSVLGVLSTMAPAARGDAADTRTDSQHHSAMPGWQDDDVLRGRILGTLRRMTLEEKVGQLFVTHVYGDTADTADPAHVAANRAEYGVDNPEQVIAKYHLGGVVYVTGAGQPFSNPTGLAQLSNGLQRAALGQRVPVPLLLSVNQEPGAVATRITEPATRFPNAMAMGAGRDPQQAYTAAEIMGRELHAMGVNNNFAPVADVNVNPLNPIIGSRSFGSDPGLASALTAAQVAGYQRRDVIATAKHFPGHGDTDLDSHTDLPIITHSLEELDRIDLPPFRAAIAGGVDSIMTAHIVVPALDQSGRPATLSRPILTGLLRERLGYDGVVITDSLGMAGVRRMFGDARVPIEALKAGNDLLLRPPDMDLAYRAVLAAVRDGELTERRIEESVYRVLRLKIDRGLFEEPYVDEAAVPRVVGAPGHWAAAHGLADRSVTLVKNDDQLLPHALGAGERVLVTGAAATDVLAARLAARGATTTVLPTGSKPNDATVDRAVAAAADNDLVVVLTNRALSSAGQQRLVTRLNDSDTPVVVVAVREPYDLGAFPAVPTYLAAYDTGRASIEALTRVLVGEISPTGRLPVSIPGPDGSTLYEYGHGLSYQTAER